MKILQNVFSFSFCHCSCTTEVASRDTIRLTWHTSSYNKMGQTNISTPYKLKGSKQKQFLQKGNRGWGGIFAWSCSIIISRMSRVVKSSMLLLKITAYLVSIGWLVCLALFSLQMAFLK